MSECLALRLVVARRSPRPGAASADGRPPYEESSRNPTVQETATASDLGDYFPSERDFGMHIVML